MTKDYLKGKTLLAVIKENKDHEYSIHLYNEKKTALYYISPFGTKDSVKKKAKAWAKQNGVKITWEK